MNLHYILNDEVKTLELHIGTNNNTAPDWWAGALQGDLELIERNAIGCHAV
jgi:hypothetical protein